VKRNFVNQQADSNKFWIIEQFDNRYTVTWGKMGAKGRTKDKEYDSSEECSKEIEKLVKSKIKGGYTEISDLESAPTKAEFEYRPMDENVFWEIIASFNWRKLGDDDAVMRPAMKILVSMSLEDIEQFAEILAKKLYNIDGEAWAKNQMDEDNGYLSPDYFLYARCCIVANGKALYERILANPSEMPINLDFEALLYLAEEAYQKKSKSEDECYIDTEYCYETGANEEG